MIVQPSSPDRSDPGIAALLQKAAGHHQAGRLDDAEEAYKTVLLSDTKNFHALRLLGALYLQKNDYATAEIFLRRAIDISSTNADLWNNFGIAHRRQEKVEEATKAFDEALRLKPEHIDALMNSGTLFYETGKFLEAISFYQNLLSHDPSRMDAWLFLGYAYLSARNVAKAEECMRHILKHHPNDIGATIGYSVVLERQDKYEEAKTELEKMSASHPDNVELLVALGYLKYITRDIEGSLVCFDHALTIQPEHTFASWNKALSLLSLGHYEKGWQYYKYGMKERTLRGLYPFKTKSWDGEALPGKTLLILAEQGLGDNIQFIRYVALCKQRVGKVYVLCNKSLLRLFKNLPLIDGAFLSSDQCQYNEHVAMMSLPGIFGTRLDNIPKDIPYLFVSPEAKQKWAAKFNGVKELKIGIVWAGQSILTQDNSRSIPLEKLESLLSKKGMRFYSLQMGEATKQIENNNLHQSITDYTNEVEDFMDTAAIIQNLDLVISVDTSVAHLAGALGKPVWVLSRLDADWRWLQNQETNPWYPTARVFGQTSFGDWDTVVKKVAQSLDQLLRS